MALIPHRQDPYHAFVYNKNIIKSNLTVCKALLYSHVTNMLFKCKVDQITSTRCSIKLQNEEILLHLLGYYF